MILNIGHADLFKIILQYFTPKWFKVVFLYQAFNAGDIPYTPHSGLMTAPLIG